jgi:protein-disulfide isomerase
MSKKSTPVPPTSRRSARQQRLASREANRQLARAGTRGSGAGGDLGGLLLWTAVALVIGAVVIGGAWVITQKPAAGSSLASPIPPRVLTPTDIPANGETLGQADAPVTLDVYSDFQCPGCQAFALEIAPKLVEQYVRPGKARIAWHDYTLVDLLVGHGTESRDAANAAMCASDQGKFWRYHDWLYANQFGEGVGSFTLDRLKYIGSQMGLNTDQFNRCVDDGQHDKEIEAAQEAIPSEVQQRGTPSIMVNGTLINSYALDVLQAAIDGALNPSPSPSPSASS